jgi:BirA family biotin operon repressor/biotin-[acetyl-CoA-carboxylase] ligase
MNQFELESLLSGLPLGKLRYYGKVTSTNELAARWAESGAPHLSLIAADEQTQGRGRLGRRWLTPPGSALAFSLILTEVKAEAALAYNALGALAVCDTLNSALPPVTPAQVKWPNDVIASRRKLAGVLAEAHWRGEQLVALILGIGINIAPASVPPAELLDFPATCVEAELEKSVDRWELLHHVLRNLLEWRKHLDAPGFIQAWERRLAFRGEWVHLLREGQEPLEGQVLGLNADGSLRLRLRSGEAAGFQFGEIRLRPPAHPL